MSSIFPNAYILSSSLKILVPFLASLFFFYKAKQRYDTYATISSFPTEKVRSMSAGRTELKGEIKSKFGNVTKPFSREKAIYVEWKIEEKTESGWEVVESGTKSRSFVLDDGTGEVNIAVEEHKENIDWRVKSDTVDMWRDSFLWRNLIYRLPWFKSYPKRGIHNYMSRNNIEIVNRKRRYTEKYISPESQVYVFGYSDKIDKETRTTDVNSRGNRLKIVEDKSSNNFIISNKNEDSIVSRLRIRAILYVLFGALLSLYPFLSIYGIVI